MNYSNVKLKLLIIAVFLFSIFIAIWLVSCAGISSKIPTEVSKNSAQWPLPNKDYANTREDLTSLINSGNVEPAWNKMDF